MDRDKTTALARIKRNEAGSEGDRGTHRQLAKVENGRSEFGVKETEESKSSGRPRSESMFNASNRLKRRAGSPFHAATALYFVYSSYVRRTQSDRRLNK